MKLNSRKPYETDSSQIEGKTNQVVLPKDMKELERFVRKFENITIRGGGTGLAGGAVPTNTPIIDLSKIDKILEFNKQKKTILVEAGLILDDLQDFLSKEGLEFPINPSSHSICTIGGMIATNAVGSRAIKYGKTSEWALWLDIMNSEGEIERKNKSELGDFSGMEGITGIIVRAELKLTEKKTRKPKMEKIDSLNELIKRVKELKQQPETTMIEYLDKNVSEMIGLTKNYHLFIETETEEKEKEENKKIYTIRDRVYPELSGRGFTRIEDPQLILDRAEKLLVWLEEKNIPTYGHISVGIIHPCFSKQQENLIPEMMKMIKRFGGQITGEHGIGLLKKEFIEIHDKNLLTTIKKRLDPQNKFNPGKII
jgi:FAD/FMN-containing dehydrogenase